MLRLIPVLLLLFLVGALLHVPTLELPVEGEAARLATRAHVLVGGAGEPSDWEGASSRMTAWVTAPLTLLLPTPTIALRVSTLVLGALWAPLVLLLGLRLGLKRRVAFLAGLLTALHPALAYGAATSGSAALGCTLFLASATGLGSPGGLGRRVGAVLASVLPLAYALATPAAVLLVAFFVRRERSPLWRVLPALVLVGAVIVTPLPWPSADAPGIGVRLLALLLQWLPLAALLVLLPGLARSVRRVTLRKTGNDGLLAIAVGGGAFLVLVATLALDGGWGAALPVVPLVLLAGVAGFGGPSPRSRALLAVAGLVALGASLVVVSAPVQTTFRPRDPMLAGRLAPLGQALNAAAEAAGEGGWVGLDAPEIDSATAFRLRDFARSRDWVVLGDRESPLPEEPLERGRRFVLVSRQETWPTVTTLGGQAIFQTEVLARYGPWIVVRLERT